MSALPHEDAGPISCAEALDFLMPFVDGELEAPRAGAVERHLAACEGCRAEVDAMRAIDARARAALGRGTKAAADRVRARVFAEIDRAPSAGAPPASGIARPRPPISWRRIGGAVAAALLVATLVAGLLPGPAAADFARDHVDCLGTRRAWAEGAKAAELARAYLDGTEAPAARGYTLTRAAGCGLGGVAYVHLVYEAPAREPVSVFAGRRLGGLGGVLRLWRSIASERGFEVIEMHRGTLEIHVVAQAEEAERFADAMER